MNIKFKLIPDKYGGYIQEPHRPTIATNRTIPMSWNNEELTTANLIGSYKIKGL